MKKIRDFLNDKKDILIIGIFIIFIIMLPYMNSETLVVGADYEYHFTRIDSIKEGLKEKIFPVKVHPKMCNNYGYGTGFFYPNFFLYIPAFLCLIGVDFVISYKLFILLMLIVMIVISYISFKDVLEDKKSALIALIIYTLSNYITLQLYQRCALGEFLAAVFVPAAVAGIYNYTHKSFDKPWLIAIGFFGVINSHLISTFLCALYVIVVFIFNFKKSFKNIKMFIKLLGVAVLVAMMTAAYWGPMFEQMAIADFNYEKPWTTADKNDFGIYELFSKDENYYGIAITIALPIMIFGLFNKNGTKKSKLFVIEFLILTYIMSSKGFWNVTKPIMGIVQFKWRFLGIATAIASIAIAMILKEQCYKRESNIKIITCVVFAISIFCFFYHNTGLIILKKEQVKNGLYSLWNSIGGGTEYLPLGFNVADTGIQGCILTENFEKIPYEKVYNRFEFFVSDKEQNILYVPLLYYRGYVADITDEQGIVSPLVVTESEKHLVEIDTEGKKGKVRVWYNGTRVQKISYLVSIIGYGFVLFIITLKAIKEKMKSRDD